MILSLLLQAFVGVFMDANVKRTYTAYGMMESYFHEKMEAYRH